MLWLLVGLACEDRLGFEAVSFYPTNGWVDGCTSVRIGGHGFDDQMSVTVGGNPVTGITYPDPAVTPLDVGFEIYGTAPAGAQGYADVVVKTGANESTTLADAFYYVACPGPAHIDSVSSPIDPGGTVEISGCGFDAAAVTAYLAPAGWTGPDDKKITAFGPFTLTSACGTAIMDFTATSVPEGDYGLYLFDGTSYVPDPACVDKDTADTAVPCAAAPTVTVGGAK